MARRTLIWHNRDRLLSSVNGVVAETTLITGIDFAKGCTLIRLILDTWWTPVTTDADVTAHVAVYAGRGASGQDIRNDNDESWILWQRMLLHLSTADSNTERLQRKSWDLRAKRLARTDETDVFIRLHADASQSVNMYCSARLLCMLP